MAIYLIAFCFLYLGALFPFAYFRHDDWLIALNGAMLNTDWSKLFSSTLTHGNIERVWFFRPLVKFNGFLFWNLFGEFYFLWLVGTLLFTVAALVLAYDSFKIFHSTEKKGMTFLALFVCAPLIHFGSLTWIGEGLMNCPQLFFLTLNGWAFLKAMACRKGILKAEHEKRYTILSILAFFLALGFKESSVFHLVLLMAFLYDRRLTRFPLREKIFLILPYALLSAVYLAIRLFIFPINSDYVMRLSVFHMGGPILYFIGILGIPAFLLLVTGGFDSEVNKSPLRTFLMDDAGYFVFFAVSLAPYLSQPFFSVGWPLIPGFFFVYYLAARSRPLLVDKRYRMAAILFVIQAIPTAGYLSYLHWWDWKAPQQFLMEVIDASLNLPITYLKIAHCNEPRYTHLPFERVITHEAGLISMRVLKGGKPLTVWNVNCEDAEKEISQNEIMLRWKFPSLELVKIPSQAQSQLKELLTQRPALPSPRLEERGPRPLNGSRFPSSSPPSP